MMRKCIMVNIGGSKKPAIKQKVLGGKFINFVEIGGKCNMHHWLRGWTPLVTTQNGVEKAHILNEYQKAKKQYTKNIISCLQHFFSDHVHDDVIDGHFFQQLGGHFSTG